MIVTYFLWWVLYSVLGWIYESTLCSVAGRRWTNRGFLNGPYCPIYGFGALLVILLFGRIENPLALFLCGASVCTVLEYLTSYGMEKLFHARWWDYSKRPFNLNGRVCLLGTVVFGALSVAIVRYAHSFVQRLTDVVPMPVRYGIGAALAACLLADCLATLHAMADFQKKLEEAERALSKRLDGAMEKLREHERASTILERQRELARRISAQQRRILAAFPTFAPHRHGELFAALREELHKSRMSRKSRKGGD